MENQRLHTFISYHLTLNGRCGYFRSNSRLVKPTLMILLLVAATSGTLLGQTTGSSVTQSVTIEVKPITKISVTGNPGSLIINDAAAGANLTAVSDNNTKYSLTTNLESMKIVASINEPMPLGTKLTVMLSSSKAASRGTVDLSAATAPIDVVTGIGKCSDVDQAISYTFAANPEVGDVPLQSRVVTLTLTN